MDYVNLKIGFIQKYNRALPNNAKTAKHEFVYSMNFDNVNNCMSRDKFIEIANLDCEANHHAEVSVVLKQVYNPSLILGSTTEVDAVIRSEEASYNQKNDMRLTFTCPGQWRIQGIDNATYFSDLERELLKTDPLTCLPIKSNRTPEEERLFQRFFV